METAARYLYAIILGITEWLKEVYMAINTPFRDVMLKYLPAVAIVSFVVLFAVAIKDVIRRLRHSITLDVIKDQVVPFYFQPRLKVAWYDFLALFESFKKINRTAKSLAITDNREIQVNYGDVSTDAIIQEFGNDELWLDFTADTGDGFDDTCTIFHTLSREHLTLDHRGTITELKKGNVLILGGDLVYPDASEQEYNNRLKGPIRLVSPTLPVNAKKTLLLSIPGNHDWYDGLTTFCRMVCQEKIIGNYKTIQKRSYFAFKIKSNTHIIGVDNQLLGDIDIPQVKYFKDYINTFSAGTHHLIIVVPEPCWYGYKINDSGKYRQRMDSLKYFIDELTFMAKTNQITLHIRAVFTGDIHHYSRYSHEEANGIKEKTPEHFITCGGGGAFKHFTHHLKEEIDLPHLGDFRKRNTAKSYQKRSVYFPPELSFRKMLGNILFGYKNYMLTLLFFLLYLLLFCFIDQSTGALTKILLSPIVPVALSMIVIAVELHEQSTRSFWLKFVVPVSSFVVIVSIINLFLLDLYPQLLYEYIYSDLTGGEIVIINIFRSIFIASFYSIISCTLFGIFLIIQFTFNGKNITEVSSSVDINGYNSFIRMKITKDNIECFVIGLDKSYPWLEKVRSLRRSSQKDKWDTLKENDLKTIFPEEFKEGQIKIIDHFNIRL